MTELLALAAVAVLVFVLAALTQAVTGFGATLAAIPGLLLVTDPGRAVVGATTVSLILAAGIAYRERAHVDRRDSVLLTVTGIVGMPLGLVLISVADERLLTVVIAVVMLVVIAAMAVGLRVGRGGVPVVGVISGVLLTATGMNGAVLVMALVDREPRRYRATLQSVFVGQNLIAVAAFVALGHVDLEVLVLVLGGVAGLPLGWRLGDALFHRVPAGRLRPLVIVTLFVAAAAVLVDAVV